jgi:minor capsid protein
LSLLDGLARYLDLRGLGHFDPAGDVQLLDWSIFIEQLPQQPDRVIGLWQYAGAPSDSRNPWEQPAVQVRVRGSADPRESRTRAQAIYDEVHGLGMLALPDGTWLQLALGAQGGPIPLGPDQSGRHEHTVNLQMHIDHPTIHRPA